MRRGDAKMGGRKERNGEEEEHFIFQISADDGTIDTDKEGD